MIRIYKPGLSLSVLSASIVIVPIAVAALTPSLLKSPGQLDWVRGEWTLAYEKAFDAQLSIRDFAISTWALIEYGLFKGGRPGVLVGSEDWLFTTEEFQLHAGGASQTRRTLDVVLSVSDFLEERGIKLVVAVIPDKSRVYQEHLGRYTRPDYVADRYESFRGALIRHGVVAPDLSAPMLAAKESADVFLHTDTHWTPAGAEVAAEAIAISVNDPDLAAPRKTFKTVANGSVRHDGDLLSFIPLGLLSIIGPKPDIVEKRQTASTDDSSLGLFDATVVPVALVGTSYSANSLWNFAGALSQHLGVEIANAAQEGKGPMVPMIEYLKSPTFVDSPPTMVVWEIPERFIEVDYAVDPV